MMKAPAIDVHQHLWPAEFVDRLRARRRPPYLRGWTLFTRTEAPYEVDPRHHDVETRMATDQRDGVGVACLSMSSPLGIEYLPRAEADELIAAWHQGVLALPGHFAAWASVPAVEPDLGLLAEQLRARFVGLQLPATELTAPVAWERAGDILRVAEEAGKPVFVHPGPALATPPSAHVPAWWTPVVTYATQMQATWWAWQAVAGRTLFPSLRVLFGAGAGLAPLHHERAATRGGPAGQVDPRVYLDTSSYGPRALDALVRVLGVDVLTLGSDRPYGAPLFEYGGEAATHAIRAENPRRLLAVAGSVQHESPEGGGAWARAS